MNYLQLLESESVHILRETAAQFRQIALLFSGGKDSACLLRLAEKAFRPARFPLSLVHIDTGHNFPETLAYRDEAVRSLGEKLVVRYVQDSVDQGKATDPQGPNASRNAIQSITLMDTITALKFDAVIGGARRDEEKARAKERIFSFRNEFGQWDPRNQRPELWNLYNGKLNSGDHMRIFPLSNWTELDVWNFIRQESLPLPPVYFAHLRKIIRKKNGILLADCPFVQCGPEDRRETLTVRCRTVGDMTCTGMIESKATHLDQIIEEVVLARTTERGTRIDDKVSESAMEDRKKRGYF